MTNHERRYEPQPVDDIGETEAERFDREQKEGQAATGETNYSNSGSMDAQNTPGPETQSR